MKKIVQLLTEQIEASRVFTKRNFGLEVGSDYPEIVRECVAEDSVAMILFIDTLKIMMASKDEIQEALESKGVEKGPSCLVSQHSIFYGIGMKFFYWGMQVGRELEKAQNSTLSSMKEG